MEKPAPDRENDASVSASYARGYIRGAFWSLTGTVGLRFFSFVTNVIVARFLGQIGFGELAMIQSTIGFLETFSNLGMIMTATKYVAELRFQDPERTGRIIGLTYVTSWTAGILMALACISAAPWLAVKTLNAPHLVPELRLASLVILVSTGFGPQLAILAGFHSFRSIAKVNLAQGLLNLPVTVALVWYAGLSGVILAMLITVLTGAIIAALALFSEYRAHNIRPNFLKSWQERGVLLNFSLPAFLASVLHTPVIWMANAVLVNQPSGYAQLGLFRAASQFQFLIRGVDMVLAQVSVPFLSEIYGRGDRARFAKAINLNLKFIWSLAIALGFFCISLTPWLIQIFGKSYQASGVILPLVFGFTVLNVGTSVNSQAFYGSGKMWLNFFMILVWAGILIGSALVYVPAWGGFGLAMSHAYAHGLIIIFQILTLQIVFAYSVLRSNLVQIIFSFFLIFSGILGYHSSSSLLFQIINFLLALSFICYIFLSEHILSQYNHFVRKV